MPYCRFKSCNRLRMLLPDVIEAETASLLREMIVQRLISLAPKRQHCTTGDNELLLAFSEQMPDQQF